MLSKQQVVNLFISVLFVTQIFCLENVALAADQKFMTDEEAMTPKPGGTICESNPARMKKMIDELEKKTLCMFGLTKEECHSLYALGGGGAIAAGAAAWLGNRKIRPDDVQCSATQVSRNYFDLIFPKAHAAFCRLRARSPMVEEADRIAKLLAQQQQKDMDEEFKSSRMQQADRAALEENKKKLAAKVESAKSEWRGIVDRYKSNIEDMVNSGKISPDQRNYLFQKIDAGVTAMNNNSFSEIKNAISGSSKALKIPLPLAEEDLGKLSAAAKDSAASLKEAASAVITKITPEAIADQANEIEQLKLKVSNGMYSDEFVREELKKFKAKNPNFDVESMMTKRTRIVSIGKSKTIINGSISQFQYGHLDEPKFLKAITGVNFNDIDDINLKAALDKILKLSKGLKLNIHDSSHIARNIARATVRGAKSMAVTTGKAMAHGANPIHMVLEGAVMGMPLNCEKNFAEMEGHGNNTYQMVGYNYMTFDKDTCKPEVDIQGNFAKFFEIESIDRLKLARYNPKLCGLILQLAEKELIGSQYQIQCNKGTGGFSLFEPTNAQVNARMTRETAGMTAAERADYMKLARPANFDHTVTQEGNTLQVRYHQTTQPLSSCKNFSYNLETDSLSEQRNLCSTLTHKVTDHSFDYSQISQCCNGESNAYCEVFGQNFINSEGEVRTGSGNGTNVNSIRTRK